MRVSAILIAVLLAAFLVAGCGGSSGGSSSSASSSSASTSEAGGESSTAGKEESGSEETGKEETGKQETGKEETSETSEEAGGSETSATPLSKKAFVKKGDAICEGIPKTYGNELKALERELKKKGKKPTKSEQNLRAAVPPLHVAVEEFQQLSPPEGEEAKVEAIIKALESAAKGLEEKPESELSGPKSPFNEFQKLTKAYGLQFCSQL